MAVPLEQPSSCAKEMSYRNLKIWQLAQALVVDVHRMTLEKLPKFEMFETGSQIRRSVKSVKSSIVEGYGRSRYKQEYVRFLTYALGSCDETIDHLETLAETGSLRDQPLFEDLHSRLDHLGRMINRFRAAIERSHRGAKPPFRSDQQPATSKTRTSSEEPATSNEEPAAELDIHCSAMYRQTMKLEKELVAASSVPLVLSILSEGDNYGYAIIQRVKELSGGEIEWTDGMLYPVLHWLEDQGLVRSRWAKSESGRKRKYYALQPDGRQALQQQKRQWTLVASTLNQLWRPRHA